MKRKIRVGVIGAGFGARILVPAFQNDKRCEVTAIGASGQTNADRYAKRLGLSKAYGDWKHLVSDPDIDVIAIAVPPDLQPAIVLKALQNDKPVFCEKPVSVKLSDAQKMAQLVAKKKIASAVDFEFPEIAAFRKAKQFLDQKKCGRLRHVCLNWQVETYANEHKTKSWKNDDSRGGGALQSFVSHSFYYLEWLLGPISALNARLRTAPDLSQTQDTVCMMRLFFKSGIYANLTVSTHALHGSGHRLEVYGDKGSLFLSNGAKDYIDGFKLFYGSRLDATPKPVALKTVTRKTPDGRMGAVAGVVSRFIDAIEQKKAMQPNLQNGFRVQQLIAAAQKSSALAGKAIWV